MLGRVMVGWSGHFRPVSICCHGTSPFVAMQNPHSVHVKVVSEIIPTFKYLFVVYSLVLFAPFHIWSRTAFFLTRLCIACTMLISRPKIQKSTPQYFVRHFDGWIAALNEVKKLNNYNLCSAHLSFYLSHFPKIVPFAYLFCFASNYLWTS